MSKAAGSAARGSVRASLIWSYAAHLVGFVIGFGAIVAISRLLTQRELGIVGVGLAIAAILNVLSSFGVANFLVRDRDHVPGEGLVRTCFTVNGILCVIVSAVLLSLGLLGGELFSEPAIGRVLIVLAPVPLFAIFEMLPSAMLTREMRFGPLSLLQVGKGIASAVVMVVAALRGWSYLSPAFGALAGGIFGAVATSLVGRRYVRVGFSLRGATEVARFTVQIVAVAGIPLLTSRFAELVVAQFLGLAALGLYTRATGFAALVWDYAYGLSTRVIYAQMAQDIRNTGSLRDSFLAATRMLTAVFWPAMLGVAVLAGPIMHYLYGPRWDAAALPLAILMVAQAIAIGFAMAVELCVLTGRMGWQVKVETGRALVSLLALTVGAMISLPAAALGRVVDSLAGYLAYRPKMPEMAGASARETRQAYGSSLLAALLTVMPVALVMGLNGWSPSAPLLQIGLAVALGCLAWISVLARTGHPLWAELRKLLMRGAAGT